MKIESARLHPLHRSTQQDELDQKLKEVSKSYEKHFLREMVKAMRSSVSESDLVQKNMAERIYSEKMDEQYVETWGDGGGIGLADLIYEDVKAKILGVMPEPQGLPKVIMPMPVREQTAPILKMQEDSFELSTPPPAAAESSAVVAPMDGVIHGQYQIQDRNYVRLDHGPLGTSILSYVGWAHPFANGDSVAAAQDLGRVVDSEKQVHWRWQRNKV